MVTTKELTLLSLDYQKYLTQTGIIWTVGISFFIAIISYGLVSWESLNQKTLIFLGIILIMVEISFIATYFWVNNKKESLRTIIENK